MACHMTSFRPYGRNKRGSALSVERKGFRMGGISVLTIATRPMLFVGSFADVATSASDTSRTLRLDCSGQLAISVMRRRVKHGNLIRLTECAACTEDIICVSCYLDLRQIKEMEEEREIELEGYIDG